MPTSLNTVLVLTSVFKLQVPDRRYDIQRDDTQYNGIICDIQYKHLESYKASEKREREREKERENKREGRTRERGENKRE